MNAYALSCLAVLAAYLIGAIPFGYLIARWAGGIDIRTVGSGNIGATNVGRVLGFRFFVLVFVLDLLKGFLPTFGFPRLVELAAGQPVAALGVFVALASILGHNFPVYLGFRGGKGVATSLGAVLALDPLAAVGAAAGFGVALLATRYVSVSSLFAGVVFAAVHFALVKDPLGPRQVAMTALTIALLVLLVVRHRKNLARLRAGTEPRVPLGRRKKTPVGKIAGVLLLALGFVSVLIGVAVQASRRAELKLGPCVLTEVARVGTGYQRAERLAFADRGRLLAVTCPRYNRLVLYRVSADGTETLDQSREISLAGRPVALRAAADRVYVLERPPGDARHVEPGFWETFDFGGHRIDAPYRVGFYPDDLALTAEARFAIVLTSGRSEGGANRAWPSLSVIALGSGTTEHRVVGQVAFEGAEDDPERLVIGASGQAATVLLRGPGGETRYATINLRDPERPVLAGSAAGRADLVTSLPDEGDILALDLPGYGRCVARTLPQSGSLELSQAGPRPSRIGALALRGAWNLTPARPTGIAHSPERGLVAVATRSGSVHLIAIRPVAPDGQRVAASPVPGSPVSRK